MSRTQGKKKVGHGRKPTPVVKQKKPPHLAPSTWKKRAPKPLGVKEALQKKKAVYKVRKPSLNKGAKGSRSLRTLQAQTLKKMSQMQELLEEAEFYLGQIAEPDDLS